MKKLISITLMFAFSVSIVLSQDIIYTISGQFDEENISLDSILIENITNKTKILFDDLPENPDYQINLTTKQYWGTTGINSLKEEPGFVVLRNIPGKLSVRYTKNTPINLNVSVYNINGQKIYSSGKNTLQANNIIRLELESIGVFIVKLESPDFVQSFKSIGAGYLNSFNVKITDEGNSKEILKSASTIKDADFSFEVGDSLRISSYKSGYYSPTIKFRIQNSESIGFQFIKNYLKINDNEYLLQGGIFSGIDGNKPDNLVFLSPEFNLATFENDGNIQADEPGAIVSFDVKYTEEKIESDTFYLSTPEEMNTELTCDKDINGDGIINNDDCYYKLPDGKFYISSDGSFYASNFDLNDENYEAEKFFQSGYAIITRNKDFYIIEFDCVGENGDKVKGIFAGYLHFFIYVWDQ